ncbi:MAG: tagaturonate reductase [Rhodothermales bacterium]
MPALSQALITSDAYQSRDDLQTPRPSVFDLPEKVLQFGTGGFLRGFCDFFIDQAIKAAAYDGRVVMVGSTGSGRSANLAEQDGLYTVTVRGIDQGETIDRDHVIASVSRALSAKGAWADVLAVARSADLEVIISNTTEVGIQLDTEDRIDANPPRSFPGKLTAALYERAKHFDYSPDTGVIVLPCELIENNGEVLKSIVQALAEQWALGPDFLTWLETAVTFCNALVDRIVPGTPRGEALDALYNRLGYTDDLLTVAEVYTLWAIEGDASVRERLGFTDPSVNPGIVVAEDITPYRERKVRVLNGTHTSFVAAAFLSERFVTVLDVMRDEQASAFVEGVAYKEIVPSLDVDGGPAYAEEVLDRFRNPFLRHHLIDITLQTTMKLRARVVPTILSYVEKTGAVPTRIAYGFAAYLRFMRVTKVEEGRYFGSRSNDTYPIRDDHAGFYHELWDGIDLASEAQLRTLAHTALAHTAFWGVDLNTIGDFGAAVADAFVAICREGAFPSA